MKFAKSIAIFAAAGLCFAACEKPDNQNNDDNNQDEATGDAITGVITVEPDFAWDNTWTLDNWVYTKDWNAQYTGVQKYEPQYWDEQLGKSLGEKGVDDVYPGWLGFESDGEISIGMKFSAEMLERFGGKTFNDIYLFTTNDYVETLTYSLVTVKAAGNVEGDCAEVQGKLVSVDEVLYTAEVTPGDNWYNNFSPAEGEEWTIPESGEVMLLATLTGDGMVGYDNNDNVLSMLFIREQPYNKFAPTYVSLLNAEGERMYELSDGTAILGFVVNE